MSECETEGNPVENLPKAWWAKKRTWIPGLVFVVSLGFLYKTGDIAVAWWNLNIAISRLLHFLLEPLVRTVVPETWILSSTTVLIQVLLGLCFYGQGRMSKSTAALVTFFPILVYLIKSTAYSV